MKLSMVIISVSNTVLYSFFTKAWGNVMFMAIQYNTFDVKKMANFQHRASSIKRRKP